MEQRDEKLWRIAKRRAGFKITLLVYVLVNSLLWIVWALTMPVKGLGWSTWPLYPMFGWGIGLFFQFVDAYWTGGETLVEKEYKKLQEKNYK
jgi:hypothetical protein